MEVKNQMRDASDIQMIRIFRRKEDDIQALYIQEFFKFAGCIVQDQICEAMERKSVQDTEESEEKNILQKNGKYDVEIILNIEEDWMKDNIYPELKENLEGNVFKINTLNSQNMKNFEKDMSLFLMDLIDKIWQDDKKIKQDIKELNIIYANNSIFWYIYAKANFKYIQEYFPDEKEEKDALDDRSIVYHEMLTSFRNAYDELNNLANPNRSFYFRYAMLLLKYKMNGLKLLIGEQRIFHTEGLLECAHSIQASKHDFIRIYYLAANICARDSRYQSMVCDFLGQTVREIEKKNGDSKLQSFLYYQMGRYYEKVEKNMKLSKQYYNLSGLSNPMYYRVLYKQAYIFKQQQKWDEAIFFANKLHRLLVNGYDLNKIMPKQQIYAYKCLILEGDLRFETKDYDLAEGLYRKAVEISQTDSVFFEHFPIGNATTFRKFQKLGMPVKTANLQIKLCQSLYL